jgi:Protein of unknown function (DUF3592)
MFFATFVVTLLAPMLIGATVGAILIGMALSGLWHSWQTRHWHITTGTVTRAQIAEQRVKTRMVYQTKVSYAYAVNNRQYQSSRVFIGDRLHSSDRLTAEQQLRHYQPGSEVTVYYNPRDPKDAVLELKTHPVLYWLLGGGSFFLGISLLISWAILPSAMQVCGITPTSTHAKPGSPTWCQQSKSILRLNAIHNLNTAPRERPSLNFYRKD